MSWSNSARQLSVQYFRQISGKTVLIFEVKKFEELIAHMIPLGREYKQRCNIRGVVKMLYVRVSDSSRELTDIEEYEQWKTSRFGN